LRQARRNWLKDLIQHPGRLFESLYVQTIGIIQAPDLMPDGRADMCDSCPDMTVYDGKLINSCRMDEYRLFGGFLSVTNRANGEEVEMPPEEEIPDAVEVASTAISRWTIPHTEIDLVLISEGERQGEWLFSTRTVATAEKNYNKVRHLPYQPGRKGGHVEELRSGSSAILLLKLAEVMPPWFRSEIGGMLVWQWFGLGLLVVLLALAIALVSWIGKRWRRSHSWNRYGGGQYVHAGCYGNSYRGLLA